MNTLLAIIVTLAGILSPIILMALSVDYVAHKSFMKEYPVLKFKSFLSFYDLNPDRWKLNLQSVDCKVTNRIAKEKWGFEKIEHETFCFNYIDTKRYKHWLKNLEKYKQSQSNTKKTAFMIAAVKEDIASIEALAQQRQNEAINILRSMHNI